MSLPTNTTTESGIGTHPIAKLPMSKRVINAVAEVRECDPADLDPLYEYVDPDALNKLFAPLADGTTRSDGCVHFRMEGRDVVVENDGTVDATPTG